MRIPRPSVPVRLVSAALLHWVYFLLPDLGGFNASHRFTPDGSLLLTAGTCGLGMVILIPAIYSGDTVQRVIALLLLLTPALELCSIVYLISRI